MALGRTKNRFNNNSKTEVNNIVDLMNIASARKKFLETESKK